MFAWLTSDMLKLVLDDSPQGLLKKCQLFLLRFQVYKLILCRYVDLISIGQVANASTRTTRWVHYRGQNLDQDVCQFDHSLVVW